MNPRHLLAIGTAATCCVVSSRAANTGARRFGHPQTPISANHPPIGPLARGTRLSVTVTLPICDEAALTQLILDQANPRAPQFLRYLTPTQFGERFGAAPAEYAALQDYLRQKGLSVTATYPSRLAIRAEGAVESVESAFDVAINRYRRNGGEVYANDRTPSLPDSLGISLLSVSGMDNAAIWKTADAGSPPFTPQAINKAYNFLALRNRGFDGHGQSVAILSFADYSSHNVQWYADHVMEYASPSSSAKFDTSHIVRVPVSGGTTQTNGEADLDIEMCLGTLPEARILIYISPGNNGMIDILTQFFNETDPSAANVMTCSVIFNERQFLPGWTSWLDNHHALLMQGAAEGRTLFCASGDAGSNDPGVDTNGVPWTGPNVDYPASDPYTVAVGGTNLFLTGSDAYDHETGWGNLKPDGGTNGSGGGYSAYFNKAPWQTGPGLLAENGKRPMPDVALDAAVDTGYLCPVPDDPGWFYLSGGTSASAPQWASAMVMMQQAIGRPFYALPILYAAYNKVNRSSPFHDITAGTNGGYNCGPGFDLVTGMGSADFGALAPLLQSVIADANGNGAFETSDVIQVLKAAAGLANAATIPNTPDAVVVGDINADGKLSVEDAVLMAQRLTP